VAEILYIATRSLYRISASGVAPSAKKYFRFFVYIFAFVYSTVVKLV